MKTPFKVILVLFLILFLNYFSHSSLKKFHQTSSDTDKKPIQLITYEIRSLFSVYTWLKVDEYFHTSSSEEISDYAKLTLILDPKFIDAYKIYSWHTIKNSSEKEVIPVLEKGVEVNKNSIRVNELYYEMGWTYLQKYYLSHKKGDASLASEEKNLLIKAVENFLQAIRFHMLDSQNVSLHNLFRLVITCLYLIHDDQSLEVAGYYLSYISHYNINYNLNRKKEILQNYSFESIEPVLKTQNLLITQLREKFYNYNFSPDCTHLYARNDSLFIPFDCNEKYSQKILSKIPGIFPSFVKSLSKSHNKEQDKLLAELTESNSALITESPQTSDHPISEQNHHEHKRSFKDQHHQCENPEHDHGDFEKTITKNKRSLLLASFGQTYYLLSFVVLVAVFHMVSCFVKK